MLEALSFISEAKWKILNPNAAHQISRYGFVEVAVHDLCRITFFLDRPFDYFCQRH